MQINQQITEELSLAIKERTSESFETETSGRLKHFISSEGKERGMYIGTIEHEGKQFKIYMI